MRARGLFLVMLVGMLVAGGLRAQAADYETCFAFDPVFVQADQRRAPPVAEKPKSVPAARPKDDGEAPKPPRISLQALEKALESLTTTLKNLTNDALGR